MRAANLAESRSLLMMTWILRVTLVAVSLCAPATWMGPIGTAAAAPRFLFRGGSSDILIVAPRDASIVTDPNPGDLRILLEPTVYDRLEAGVVDGTLQYLSIESERFFVTRRDDENALFAFDCLGFRYLIVPHSPSSQTAE